MADPDIEETAEELFEEEPKENGNLPEAPTSITVRGYYKGFSVLITKRNATNKVELKRIIQAIDNMVEEGFKPSWKDEPEPKKDKDPDWITKTDEEPKTKTCLECGGTAEFRTGVSKAGKRYAGWFCQDVKEHVEWVSLKKT